MPSLPGESSRIARLGNQPLGTHLGMGLNDALSSSRALGAEIEGAVRAAKHGSASRAEIFDMFADRASRAAIYRLIDAAVSKTGAQLARTKFRRVADDAMTEDEQVEELAELMPAVHEVERLAAGKEEPAADPVAPGGEVRRYTDRDLVISDQGVVTIDISAGMCRALVRAETLMEMAEHPDGSGIRNPRLMVVAVDLYGKTAERKARIDADLSDASQQGAYLRAITDAVLAEPADVKSRILSRMRGVSARWGV